MSVPAWLFAGFLCMGSAHALARQSYSIHEIFDKMDHSDVLPDADHSIRGR